MPEGDPLRQLVRLVRALGSNQRVGKPFARSLQALALAAGATLALGSLLGLALAGFGRMNAALALNRALDEDRFLVGFSFDPLPVVLGFAIMALAFVFRAGHRLQRDTEGLV